MNNYSKRAAEIKAKAPDNSKKISELEKEAYALANKYNFDSDDGGGGRTAPLIVFDPDKYVKVVGTRKIGKVETFVADILK